MGLGERCKFSSGVWGKASTEKRFGAYLSQKGSSCGTILWIFVRIKWVKIAYLLKH